VDRAFKLRFLSTPEYGRYVKYPYGICNGLGQARVRVSQPAQLAQAQRHADPTQDQTEHPFEARVAEFPHPHAILLADPVRHALALARVLRRELRALERLVHVLEDAGRVRHHPLPVHERRHDALGVQPQVPGLVVRESQLDVDEAILVGHPLLGQGEPDLLRTQRAGKTVQDDVGLHRFLPRCGFAARPDQSNPLRVRVSSALCPGSSGAKVRARAESIVERTPPSIQHAHPETAPRYGSLAVCKSMGSAAARGSPLR
jgi:hypothetical protein